MKESISEFENKYGDNPLETFFQMICIIKLIHLLIYWINYSNYLIIKFL